MVTFYEDEKLDPEDDDGTIVENKETLKEELIGHRITSVSSTMPEGYENLFKSSYTVDRFSLFITLDTGKVVALGDTSDCCAYTELETFLLHPDKIDHIITNVTTAEGYTKWRVVADGNALLDLTLEWSSGNPFYYMYGFDIKVIEPDVVQI